MSEQAMRELRSIPHLVEVCPLFACEKCQAIDNVVCTIGYHSNFEAGKPVLCSECAEGQWHGMFRKMRVSETDYLVSDQRILLSADGARRLGHPQFASALIRAQDQTSWQSIYVIPANGLVKIGIASDVNRRLAALRTGNPHIESVAYASAKLRCAGDVEKAVHLELAAFKVRGEWFRCAPEIAIAAIRRLEVQ